MIFPAMPDGPSNSPKCCAYKLGEEPRLRASRSSITLLAILFGARARLQISNEAKTPVSQKGGLSILGLSRRKANHSGHACILPVTKSGKEHAPEELANLTGGDRES